jgi:hypothetical protein
MWEEDPEKYYLRYIAGDVKEEQTQAMAVGASFDAYVKSWLSLRLLGSGRGYAFEDLFEAQVDLENRDWAREHGGRVFEAYKQSGILSDFLLELQGSAIEPRFEFRITGVVRKEVGEEGVPLLGRPDVSYEVQGKKVIHDWKVNGYLSKRTVSPKTGYVQLYEGGERYGAHKNAQVLRMGGLDVNVASTLDRVERHWATQLSFYAWLLGAGIGTRFLTSVHQVCCQRYRMAVHRMYVDIDWQNQLWTKVKELWTRLERGTVIEDELRRKSLDSFVSAGDEWRQLVR